MFDFFKKLKALSSKPDHPSNLDHHTEEALPASVSSSTPAAPVSPPASHLLLDEHNHSREYREHYFSGDFYAFEDFFSERYENKLDHFSDKVDDLIDIFDEEEHPDKTILRFDKAMTYLQEKVYPFFEEMRRYYGDTILDDYREYVDRINKARQDFIDNKYDEQLAAYNEAQQEKTHEKEIAKAILSSLRKSSPIKRADLLRQFPDADRSLAQNALTELSKKKKICISRPEGKIGGPLYVSLL